VHVYEGVDGIKRYYELMYVKTLGRGDTHYSMFVPKSSNEKYEAHMLEWHTYRIKKGIKAKYLYNQEDRRYGAVRARMKGTEVRYMRDDAITPVYLEFFGDYAAIVNSGDEPYVFVMHGKGVVKTFKHVFETYWVLAEK